MVIEGCPVLRTTIQNVASSPDTYLLISYSAWRVSAERFQTRYGHLEWGIYLVLLLKLREKSRIYAKAYYLLPARNYRVSLFVQ